MNDTPETDQTASYDGNWDTKALRMTAKARSLERERDALRNQLREMVNAKGRFNTQKAMEKLISLLPENIQNTTSREDFS